MDWKWLILATVFGLLVLLLISPSPFGNEVQTLFEYLVKSAVGVQ